MRFVVWWKQTPQSPAERTIVEAATVLDAIAEQNKHADAYESGRWRIEDA